MITLTTDKVTTYTPTRRYIEGTCLSSDAKPTEGIMNGSTLIEMDTASVYFYDEENANWEKFE